MCHLLFCFAVMEAHAPSQWSTTTGIRLSYMAVHVSLTPYPNVTSDSGFSPIGLLFSREELEEAVDCFKAPDGSRIRMGQELRQMLFEWTMGHTGVVGDLLYMLSRVVSPAPLHDY
jgi:hypothetical protein